MFDIGGWEFLLIAILGIIVIGPKELPGAIRTVSGFMRRARELAREFQSGLEEVAREAELDKMTKEFRDVADPDAIRGRFEDTVDPEGEVRHAMDFDREWRDDDLTDFSEAYDEENRIAPPSAPPGGEPADSGNGGEAAESGTEGDAGAGDGGDAGSAPGQDKKPGTT